MRKISLSLTMLTVMVMASAALAADEQQRSGAGGSAAAQDLDKLFIESAAVHGMFEQQLSEAAQQQASDQQVKQFAQRMVQDHSQANQKLKEVAQKIGVNVPQQLPEMKQRELDAIKAQQGKEFDQAYLSCMKKMHLADVSAFGDKAQLAKNEDVKRFAAEQLPTLQQHQTHVISLASAQGLPNPTAEAQQAGARISGDSSSSGQGHGEHGEKPRAGEGPDAGQRGTQGRGQETGKEQSK